MKIEGFMRGSNAKADLDTIESMRSSGTTVAVTIMGHGGQVWETGNYLIGRLFHDLESGHPEVAGGEKAPYEIDLIKVS